MPEKTGETLEKVSLRETLREGMRVVRDRPFLALAVVVAQGVLAGGGLVGVIPFFAPVVTFPLFPYLLQSHQLLALALALYVGYRWHPILGFVASFVLLFVAPLSLLLGTTPRGPELIRILLVVLAALFGLRFISLLRLALGQAQEREGEIKAHFYSSPIGIYIIQDGKFQFVNPRFQQDIGFSAAELLGTPGQRLVLPEDRDMLRENAIKMLKGQRSEPYEYRVLNKAGEVRFILESVVSIQCQRGRATLGSFMDITEHKRAEELVLLREREIKATAQLSIQVLNERLQFLEEADKRGKRLERVYRLINLAYGARSPLEIGREFLRPLQEEVGAQCAMLRLVNPDGSLSERIISFWGVAPFSVSPRPSSMAEQAFRTKQSQYIADATIDRQGHPDLRQAGFRSSLAIPLLVEDTLAAVVSFHSTQPDALRQEREFLESITQVFVVPLMRAIHLAQVDEVKQDWEVALDALGEGVVVMDEQRHIIRANQAFAQQVGIPLSIVPGKKICYLLHGGEDPMPSCPLERAIALGKGQAVEWCAPHQGSILLDIRILPVPTRHGEARRFVHLSRRTGA